MRFLAFLFRIPREVWFCLAAAACVSVAYRWAYDKGADAVRDQLQPRLDAAKANIDLLEGAIEHQSRQIEALRADERKAREAAQRAAQAGERVRLRLEPRIEPVRSMEPSGCATAPEARALWEVM